ncbi:hypothetical protein CCH79_00014140, partial [Gambusia affinis]
MEFTFTGCTTNLSVPERLIQGVPMGVAPVLHVNAEAVVTLVGQQMNMMVAQPVFSSCFTKTISVFSPATVAKLRLQLIQQRCVHLEQRVGLCVAQLQEMQAMAH